MVWDADKQRLFKSHPIIIFVTADSPGMAYMNGLVGHHGAQACRLFCPQRGRRKPRGSHYYPAMLKPLNYHERGCDHDDIPLRPPPLREGEPPPPTPTERYNAALRHVLGSRTQAEFERRRLETGIVKPSIFSGLPRNVGIPGCFPGDMMHHVALNLTELLIGLWRGTFTCSPTDNVDTWDWACLRDEEVWESHGRLVAEATKYLPGSFGRPPRNPAEMISSGYKAWEFYYYVFGLLPGLLWSLQKPVYHTHFCKLVSGIRFGLQRTMVVNERPLAHQRLTEFVLEYEQLYYQRRVDRLHLVRQSIHTLIHIIPEGARVGPGSNHTQWILETAIGNLTREIRLHSQTYANLSERAARRAQVNALYAIFPELVKEEKLPPGAIVLGC